MGFQKLANEKLLPSQFRDIVMEFDITETSRKKYRQEVDALLHLLLDAETPEEVSQLLSETPPVVLFHYAERLGDAKQALLHVAEHMPQIQMQDSDFGVLLRKLLFQ